MSLLKNALNQNKTQPSQAAPAAQSAPLDLTGGMGNAAMQEQLRAHGPGAAQGEDAHGGNHTTHTIANTALAGELATAALEARHLSHAIHAGEVSMAPTMTQQAIGNGVEMTRATGGATGAAARGLGAVAGPLAMTAGVLELQEAQESWENGERADAVRVGTQGTLSTAGGAATTATAILGTEAVGGTIAGAGPVAACGVAGMVAGHAMDEASRESGAVTRTVDRVGRGMNAGTTTETESMGMSDWLGAQMDGVREATGSDAAAMAAGILMLPGVPVAWGLHAFDEQQRRAEQAGPGPERF